MATYFMFGKYTPDAIRGVSPDRTRKAIELIEDHNGKVQGIYGLLGEHDLVLILDLPDTGTAMKISVALHRMTGISFCTEPAVSVEEFDHLMGNG